MTPGIVVTTTDEDIHIVAPEVLLAPLLEAWERGDDGIERSEAGFSLRPQLAWSLPDAALASLGMERLSAPIRVREAGGVPGKPRYAWRLTWPAGMSRAGCALERGGVVVVVPPAVLELPGLCEGVAGASRRKVFRSLLRAQRIARDCPLVRLEGRLERVSVREAGMVRVSMDGDAADPIPTVELVESARPHGLGDTPDWGPSDEPEPEPIHIPDAVLFNDLVSRAADDSVVRVQRGEMVILPKGVFQNALLARAAADQPVEVRRRFAENPTAFLPDPDAFDEAHYSARVVGVGEAPRGGGGETGEARTWADPGDGLLLELPTGPLFVEREALPELAAVLREARARGEGHAQFQGVAVPCLPGVVEAVVRAAEPRERSDDASPEDRPAGPMVLRIQENEVVLDWSPVRAGGRAAPHPGLPALADGLTLRSHQVEALAHLRNLWCRGETGALLCDDMGLGKTLQALTFAAWVEEQLQSGGGARGGEPVLLPIMVVGPPSLLEGWLAELGRRLPAGRFPRVLWGAGSLPGHAHGREVRLLKRFRRDAPAKGGSTVVVEHARLDLDAVRDYAPGVLFIGYDALRTMQFAVGELRVGLVIADEAQQVKNPSSLRSHALRAMNYDFALALTGTPIENSWSDLWTLCDFATPGLLGPLAEFRQEYPQSGDVREVGPRLARALREVFIRRTRGTALSELPPCAINSVEAGMPADQALAYRAEVERYSGGGRGVLGLLQGLARVSLHPRLRATLTSAGQAQSWLQGSARTATLCTALERWQADDHAVLVFVRSIAMQETLREALQLAFGLSEVGILNGRLKLPERQSLVARFEGGHGFRVMLVSPDVGAAGWNLQFAARSFLLERPFNPAVEAQMIARTWRLGQSQPVEVLSPVATLDGIETFDQVLDQLLHDKRELAESVLAPAVVENREVAKRFAQLFPGGGVVG